MRTAWMGIVVACVGCGTTSAGTTSDAGTSDDRAPSDAAATIVADAGDAIDASDASSDALPPLPSGAYALDGVDQTMPSADLAPLRALIGDTPNVGLGESVHTSGGFEAMKARIVRDLVTNAGFRVLAMETPRSAARDVTAPYVLTCAGDAKTAAGGFDAVFAADSTRDLLAWMCARNAASPGDPVTFVGFDMQQPWDDWHELGAFLNAAAPSDAATLLAPIAKCDGAQATSEDDYWQNHFNDAYAQGAYDACTKGLDAVDAYVASNEAAMIARASAEAVAVGKIDALSLRAWQGEKFYLTSDVVKSYEARDVAMAQIYEALRAQYFPQKKAVLWAHDYHLMKDHADAVDPGESPGARNMGGVLAKDLGDGYAPIGLSGYDVEINWPGVGKGPDGPPSAGSIEATLHALGRPWLLVDLADPGVTSLVPTGTVTWGNPWEMKMVLRDQYRAIVYFESSPPMNALFW